MDQFYHDSLRKVFNIGMIINLIDILHNVDQDI